MSMHCELCRRDLLQPIYKPEGSTRGITIHFCRYCGLVQSLPRLDRAPRAGASVSTGADWGNVRYGKSFRTNIAMEKLVHHADLAQPLAVLDVGSNRGSFARALLAAAPDSHLVAVEPDERVARSCAALDRAQLIESRIEDTALESGRFDVVHSCHTIEHLAHPLRVLGDHWRTLKLGGLLIVDAPNIAILGVPDIVEEWFIDKHLYHFSEKTLGRMIEIAGFDVVERPDPQDKANLLFVARKRAQGRQFVAGDVAEADCAVDLLTTYLNSRARNLAALTAVAAELSMMAPKGVAMWGAGRLFDSLVVHGRFNAKALTLLIDKHLKAHVGERHGCALADPEALREASPGVVVVMSRGFADEIAEQAKALAPGAEILFYSDLIARARTRMAA